MAFNDPQLNTGFDLFSLFKDMTIGPFNEVRETLEALRTNEQRIKDIAAVLRCEVDQVIPKIIKLMDECNDLREEIALLQKKLDEGI